MAAKEEPETAAESTRRNTEPAVKGHIEVDGNAVAQAMTQPQPEIKEEIAFGNDFLSARKDGGDIY